jgi:hypothetical protein
MRASATASFRLSVAISAAAVAVRSIMITSARRAFPKFESYQTALSSL